MVEIHYSLASSKATITSAKGRCSQAVATIYTGKVRCTSINGRNFKPYLPFFFQLLFKRRKMEVQETKEHIMMTPAEYKKKKQNG
jgi:hypothetical protein